MMTPFNQSPLRSTRLPKRQRGVALIISLIMLVLMTLVGVAGIRVINAEERIVGQTYDRAITFQTVEATLRSVEGRIEAAGQPTPTSSSSCFITGTGPSELNICGSNISGVPRWIDSSFAQWHNSTAVSHTTGISITPQYFVEYLGDTFPCSLDSAAASNCRRYRITARVDRSDEGKASVMLQSVYATHVGSATPTTP